MKQCVLILLLTHFTSGLLAQNLILKGKVSSNRTPLIGALVDVYQYNVPLQSLQTDASGLFQVSIVAEKEYLILIYKPEYVSSSVSVFIAERTSEINLDIPLKRDEHSPNGLLVKTPLQRYVKEKGEESIRTIPFDLNHFQSRSQADSVSVLLRRAETNQFLLVTNIKLKEGAQTVDAVFDSKALEMQLNQELNSTESEQKNTNEKVNRLQKLEAQSVNESKNKKDEAQVQRLVSAQKALQDRLIELAKVYSLEQDKQLTIARIKSLQAARQELLVSKATNEDEKQNLTNLLFHLKAESVDARLQALQANKLFQFHNQLSARAYQEYIELLKYQQPKDSKHIEPKVEDKEVAKTKDPIPVKPQNDTLLNIETKQRTDLISQALQEETRFSNYTESEETKALDGEQTKVKTIRIATDVYEMQTTKKSKIKYLKNNKAVTQLTYEFETKRRFGGVLNSIKEAEKFDR